MSIDDISKQEIEYFSRSFGRFLGVSSEEREDSLQRLLIMHWKKGVDKYMPRDKMSHEHQSFDANDKDSMDSTVKSEPNSDEGCKPDLDVECKPDPDACRRIAELKEQFELDLNRLEILFESTMKTNNVERISTALNVMHLVHEI